jgi:hypothetical protein
MTSKVFSSLVVAFWLVMMGTLVRVELFPTPAQLQNVPTERILRRVFSNPEPARMIIFYQKKPIGYSRLSIVSLTASDPTLAPPTGPHPGMYRVEGDIRIYELPLYETGSQFRLRMNGECDAHYQLQWFSLNGALGANHLNVLGDMQKRKIHWTYDGDSGYDDREIDLNDKSGNALAGAMGLPAMANSMLVTGLGMQGKPGGSGGPGGSAAPLQMNVSYGRLPVGELNQKTYIVESKLNDAIWAKIWVDEQGEILMVDTSIGLSMRSDLIDGTSYVHPGGMRSRSGSTHQRWNHDRD